MRCRCVAGFTSKKVLYTLCSTSLLVFPHVEKSPWQSFFQLHLYQFKKSFRENLFEKRPFLRLHFCTLSHHLRSQKLHVYNLEPDYSKSLPMYAFSTVYYPNVCEVRCGTVKRVTKTKKNDGGNEMIYRSRERSRCLRASRTIQKRNLGNDLLHDAPFGENSKRKRIRRFRQSQALMYEKSSCFSVISYKTNCSERQKLERRKIFRFQRENVQSLNFVAPEVQLHFSGSRREMFFRVSFSGFSFSALRKICFPKMLASIHFEMCF